MKQLHTLEEFDKASQSDRKSVMIWSAGWCPDCLYLDPLLPAIEAENPDFDFYKLNRDELMDLAVDQEILGIPSLVVFENGKEVSRFVSKLRKTPQEIQAFLDKSKETE